MSPLAIFFLAGLLLCLLTCAAGVVALERLRRGARGNPRTDFLPPVSIVKPLSGLDEELEDNLESFFGLDYPEYEVVFSFASQEDPAFAVAQRVADRHPEIPSVFVVDPRETGRNAKVNRLRAGLTRARFRHLLFSDGNVRVRSDFLSRAISWFADPSVGLVSHLFRAAGARSLGSRVEALHLNGYLQIGTAAVSLLFCRPCVVGKSILLSRAALSDAGGLELVRDFLAEDYLLGQAVRHAGYRVVLSGDILDTAEVRKTWRAVWARQRRWALIRRRLSGAGYAAELFASPIPWFAGGRASAGFAPPSFLDLGASRQAFLT